MVHTDLSEKFISFSDELGLEQSSFETCLGSQTIAEEVHADYLDGGRYGVTGTPAFFVGTEKDGFIKLNGAQPYSSFAQLIESIS